MRSLSSCIPLGETPVSNRIHCSLMLVVAKGDIEVKPHHALSKRWMWQKESSSEACWAPKQLVAAGAPGRLDPSLGSRRFLTPHQVAPMNQETSVYRATASGKSEIIRNLILLKAKGWNESLHKGWPGQVAKLDCASGEWRLFGLHGINVINRASIRSQNPQL